MSPSLFSSKLASPNGSTSTTDTSLPLDTSFLSEADNFFAQQNHDEDSPLLISTPSDNNANSTAVATPSNASSCSSSATEGTQVQVFSIALLNRHKRDHIRFHQIPQTVEPFMTNLISDWGGRTLAPRSALGTIEYQLAWKAWSEFRTDKNSVCARSLLVEIMSRLALHGWNFALGMEMAKTERGKDVIFFESGVSDPGVHILCVNFKKGDRIKVIGATPEIINGMGQVIKATWPWGLQEGAPSTCRSFEFKLSGFPWRGGLGWVLRERKCIMMAKILELLRGQGYKSYATVRITKKEKEMPTLFFRKITNIFK